MKWLKSLTLNKTLPYILLIGGTVGMLSAGVLTIEKIQLLQDPSSSLACDLNPVVACGSVITTEQASAFGFPNPLIGIAGFAVIAFIGLSLLAGAVFKRWLWIIIQAGVIFGIAFATWLQYQSIYTIGALCPYCMVVWAVMIPIFWYVTIYNLQKGNIRVNRKLSHATGNIQKHHLDILVLWYFVLIGLILQRFWYYWSTLL